MKFSSQNKLEWITLGWMIFVHAVAIAALPLISWTNLFILFVFHFVTCCLGITLGFHRLIAHRSFKAGPWTTRFLALCGTLSVQRGPVTWGGYHRVHHSRSDLEGDPHNSRRGFWYAHLWWMFLPNPSIDQQSLRVSRDLQADPWLVAMDSTVVSIFLQAILGSLLWYFGSLSLMLWGVFVRLVFSYHVTWLINSASHHFGYRTFETRDDSKNCWWAALLAFGEGWHNNHHADCRSAKAGLKWWEFDTTWQCIRLLKAMGLAWDIKVFPKLNEKRLVEGKNKRPQPNINNLAKHPT